MGRASLHLEDAKPEGDQRSNGLTRVSLHTSVEQWPIIGEFRIARGAKRTADVLVVSLRSHDHNGSEHVAWAECVPYARYGESVAASVASVQRAASMLERSAGFALAGELTWNEVRRDVSSVLTGAALNAADCALWDLQRHATHSSVSQLAQLSPTQSGTTMRTVSLALPRVMAATAHELRHTATLKVKLDRELIVERLVAVAQAAPKATLVLDANESWTQSDVPLVAEAVQRGRDLGANVTLIEQPFSAQDANEASALNALRNALPDVTLCADESFRGVDSLESLHPAYGAVNVKLDKCGGLTGALQCARAARDHRLHVMLGSMVCTTLGVLPALVLHPLATWLDLDGPFLLERDRELEAPHDKHRSTLVAQPMMWGGADDSR